MSTTTRSTEFRAQLLAGLPVTEQRLESAGISTALLTGGSGPPVVLLHGPNETAAKWFAILPDLLRTHTIVAPDLPGHGETIVRDAELDVPRALDWLGHVIDRTCTAAPTLVGHIVGGAIAARFAARHPQSVARLVLVDTLGLVPFQPEPAFERALMGFFAHPAGHTYEELWDQCAYDRDRLRTRMADRWEVMKQYTLECLRQPALQAHAQAILGAFGMTPIPTEELAAIRVPTTLIWGRHDRVTRLQVAHTASLRYGWPLHVIEDAGDDPPLEQPGAFIDALHAPYAAASDPVDAAM